MGLQTNSPTQRSQDLYQPGDVQPFWHGHHGAIQSAEGDCRSKTAKQKRPQACMESWASLWPHQWLRFSRSKSSPRSSQAHPLVASSLGDIEPTMHYIQSPPQLVQFQTVPRGSPWRGGRRTPSLGVLSSNCRRTRWWTTSLLAGTSKRCQVVESSTSPTSSSQEDGLWDHHRHVRLSATHKRGWLCSQAHNAGDKLFSTGENAAQTMPRRSSTSTCDRWSCSSCSSVYTILCKSHFAGTETSLAISWSGFHSRRSTCCSGTFPKHFFMPWTLNCELVFNLWHPMFWQKVIFNKNFKFTKLLRFNRPHISHQTEFWEEVVVACPLCVVSRFLLWTTMWRNLWWKMWATSSDLWPKIQMSNNLQKPWKARRGKTASSTLLLTFAEKFFVFTEIWVILISGLFFEPCGTPRRSRKSSNGFEASSGAQSLNLLGNLHFLVLDT